MYNFYEIRNKATHRIEFMGLFTADQKPDEVFKANPASLNFAGRPDLYINVAKEQAETLEEAQSFLQQKLIDYKLVSVEEERPVIKVTKPKKESAKKKDNSIIVGDTLESRPDLGLLGGSINNVIL